jgi:hypothetical protein
MVTIKGCLKCALLVTERGSKNRFLIHSYVSGLGLGLGLRANVMVVNCIRQGQSVVEKDLKKRCQVHRFICTWFGWV